MLPRMKWIRCWTWLLFLALPLWAAGQDSGLSEEDQWPVREVHDRLDGIVTVDGRGAEGVTVLLEVTDMAVRRQIAWRRARTNEEGYYLFDLSEFPRTKEFGLQVNTSSPRYVEAMQILKVSRSQFPVRHDITLTEGAAVLGTVTDEEGNPIANVRLYAHGVRTSHSNTDGEWDVYGLAVARTSMIEFTAPGYTTEYLEVNPIKPGLIENERVVMRASANLTGVVRDPLGRNLSTGIAVFSISDQVKRSPISREGTFEFKGVPVALSGSYIAAEVDGWLPAQKFLTADDSPSDPVEITLFPGVILAGVVRDDAGNPVPGARVIVGDGIQSRISTHRADSAGRWRSGVQPLGLEFTAYAMPPGASAARATGELRLKANDDGTWKGDVDPWPDGFSSDFTARQERDTVILTRTDRGDGGIPGEVRYRGTLNDEAGMLEGTLEIPAISAKGTFAARRYGRGKDPLSGDWDWREVIEPAVSDYAPRTHKIQSGLVPGERSLKLTVDAGRTIRGTVFRERDKPLTRGKVFVRSWNESRVFTSATDIEIGGEFTLRGLPEGILEVYAQDEDQVLESPPRFLRGGISGVELYMTQVPDPMDDAPVQRR